MVASKEIGLEVNVEKTKCNFFLSREQNIGGKNHKIKIRNKSLERVEDFKYLRTTLTNQNWIRTEIESRLKSRNACYHSVQNIYSSSLLAKNTNIKVYITLILSLILCTCKIWNLTLWEENRLRVFEKRVLRKIIG